MSHSEKCFAKSFELRHPGMALTTLTASEERALWLEGYVAGMDRALEIFGTKKIIVSALEAEIEHVGAIVERGGKPCTS